ncbi:aldehyde dehydrogenase (NAD+) [Roseovarius azorensis]|uniref:Aldehyde dehydrogenase (NAD+) n=1 Tax=Roseovarius azorensis TaxID=1287727 RepID=A0A1H7XZ02_9RHOB|nr:aldehyde dehydrogenase [Roseovarius azorensis]SEM39050.1 aldehyde dehydrogenase (NAD+) [Roseovarius azorensis]
MTKNYQMYIAGAFCDAGDGQRFDSVNPATEEVWASFPEATAKDVDRAVKAAHQAFTEGPWSRTSARERGRALKRIAHELEKVGPELSVAETTDTGKLLRETRWQAGNLAEIYDYYGGLADKVEGSLPPVGPNQPLSMIVREPLGVVGAIVPWNSQLHLAAFKIAPALAAGNTIVLKPSEEAAAAIVEFARVMHAAGLPEGVFNVVTGGGNPCGQTLVSHPLVRRVSFTGGVETARKVISASVENIAMLSLELGGKSPVVVYDDADMDNVVNGVTSAIFAASGQSCAAGSRLLLQDGVYDDVIDHLVVRAGDIVVGDPMADDTQMGPLATRRQRDLIERLLTESVDAGAKVLSGGGRAGRDKGWFFEPTIVACDGQDYPMVRNELFGPVLSVLRFRDEEEAIRLARDSDYAFAGGVFSRDFGKAYRTARAIPAGRFWINTYRVTNYAMPFGGSGNSGYGREGGIEAIHDYTQTKAIFADLSGAPVADPFVMR